MTRCRALTSILLAAAAAGLAGCAATTALERSDAYARDGNYYLALHELEQARAAGETGPAIDKAYAVVKYNHLIHEGQRLIFIDREEEGTLLLQQALEVRPGDEIASALIDRAHHRLASRHAERARHYLLSGELMRALIWFKEALLVVPDHAESLAGIASVKQTYAGMRQKAQEHFLEAVRRYPELRWVEVDWNSAVALDQDRTRDDVHALQLKAQSRIAKEHLDRAEQAKSEGSYGAALMEFRTARDLDPSIAGVDDQIAHMEREVQAEGMVGKALMDSLNGKFAVAHQALRKAFEISSLEKAAISEMMLEARKREFEQVYRDARDLELQNLKAEALAGYERVAKEFPDGLQDEKVRIDNLRSDIEKAKEAWAAAEAAEQQGDKAAALELYRSVALYYPGYQDVAARIARLSNQ